MLALVFLALALLVIDQTSDWLKPVRAWVDRAVQPLLWASNRPVNVSEWADQNVVSRATLVTENQRLKTEVLILKGETQRGVDLAVENARLRNLLSARELLKTKVLVAELIGVSTNPLRHVVTINRGERDGIFVGQAALDGDGLMGQVVDVAKDHATVMLISDERHAIPVQIAEFGTRLIAEGFGDYQRLRLRHVPPTIKIKENDLLLSSGLGGRYPAGYPVGRVTSVERKPGRAFLDVELAPTAQLNHSRHLLLLFSEVNQLPGSGIVAGSEGVVDGG